MISSRLVQLSVVLLILATSPTVSAEGYMVKSISAAVGGPSTFLIERTPTERERLTSTSLLIEGTLLRALLSGASLEQIVLVPGTTTLARVYPFAIGGGPKDIFNGEYYISRIATQRMPNGKDEHLEVFLINIKDKQEKTYNVYDPFLQQILIAAFIDKPAGGPKSEVAPPRIDVKFDGNEIVSVTLGMK